MRSTRRRSGWPPVVFASAFGARTRIQASTRWLLRVTSTRGVTPRSRTVCKSLGTSLQALLVPVLQTVVSSLKRSRITLVGLLSQRRIGPALSTVRLVSRRWMVSSRTTETLAQLRALLTRMSPWCGGRLVSLPVPCQVTTSTSRAVVIVPLAVSRSLRRILTTKSRARLTTGRTRIRATRLSRSVRIRNASSRRTRMSMAKAPTLRRPWLPRLRTTARFTCRSRARWATRATRPTSV